LGDWENGVLLYLRMVLEISFHSQHSANSLGLKKPWTKVLWVALGTCSYKSEVAV
jgi:hypothetical protein